MRPQSKEHLAEWIKSLANRASNDPGGSLERIDRKIYLGSVGDKYAPELRKLSDTLLKEGGWERKVSSDYVEQGILAIALELHEHPTGKEVLPLLELLADSLDSFNEQRTVYIDLHGIDMTDIEKLQLGDVTLKKMTEAQKEQIAQELESEEDKSNFFSMVRAVPFAEMTVTGDPIKAWEVALDRVQDVLDLLRYSMPFLHDDGLDPDINVLGWRQSSPTLVAVHSGKFEVLYGSFRDLPTSVEISREAIREMEEAGFFKAAKFAGKEEKTQLERKVLRRIHWASDSQGQRDYDNKLLSLIISLECLLPSTRFSGSSSWTAEGTAIILGQNFSARKAIRNRILDLYKKRNNIVHGGESEEITADDVVWLRKTVHNLIRAIINRRNQFETPEGAYTIATWLEDRKLAAESS